MILYRIENTPINIFIASLYKNSNYTVSAPCRYTLVYYDTDTPNGVLDYNDIDFGYSYVSELFGTASASFCLFVDRVVNHSSPKKIYKTYKKYSKTMDLINDNANTRFLENTFNHIMHTHYRFNLRFSSTDMFSPKCSEYFILYRCEHSLLGYFEIYTPSRWTPYFYIKFSSMHISKLDIYKILLNTLSFKSYDLLDILESSVYCLR